MPRTVADAMVERLIEWGVDTVFGLPGDGINGLMEALRKHRDKVRYVHVRHEEVGAMAAVGYAKFTGRLGVCFSTASPGAIHLMNGIYDARLEQAPILAITGMTYHDLIGTFYLQDIHTDYLMQDACVYNERIMGPAHLENVVDLACRYALTQRGPAHLAFPIDYQAAEAEPMMRFKRNVPGHTSAEFKMPRQLPEEEDLRAAADLLSRHSRIAILAGAGARGAGDELEQVAEILGAPIIKAMLGKDCVPDDSPYVTGGLGVVGTRPSQDAMQTCDALLIVGSSFNYIEFLPKPGQAECVQIDDKPQRISARYPADVALVGDARATLRALIPLLERNRDRSFLETAQQGKREWDALMEERGTSDAVPMRPEVVSWHLARALRDDAIVCGDSGQVTTWVARMNLRRGQMFSFSGTNCSMAAALPYSIGAQTAYPDRQVVAFTGDGSLTMQMGDLATLVQENLPVKVVVFKNNALGLIKWEQMVFLGNPEYGIDLRPIDFVTIAQGFGIPAVHIEDPKACGEQLRQALAMDGPVLIEAVVDANEPPLPAKITREQAMHLAQALARGEENRVRIGLTIGRHLLDEHTFEASSFDVADRIREKLPGGDGGEQG